LAQPGAGAGQVAVKDQLRRDAVVGGDDGPGGVGHGPERFVYVVAGVGEALLDRGAELVAVGSQAFGNLGVTRGVHQEVGLDQ
jgi:hypothetical protein